MEKIILLKPTDTFSQLIPIFQADKLKRNQVKPFKINNNKSLSDKKS